MKRVLAFFLMICMLVPLVPASIFAEDLQTDTQAAENSSGGKSIMEYAADSFEYGDGSEASPYIIRTPEQLMYFATSALAGETYEGKYLSLAADIDMSGFDWIPVPTFKGVFYGNNFSIINISISISSTSTGVGFIGYNDGTIRNLNLLEATINVSNDGSYVGIITGFNKGIISGCNVSGELSAQSSQYQLIVGGISGQMNGEALISRCNSNVSISAVNLAESVIYAGGIVGHNLGGIIELSSATGTIDGKGNRNNLSGGVVGYLSSGNVTNTYSTCSIYAEGDYCVAGGVIGYADKGGVCNSYYAGDTVYANSNGSSNSYCGGIIGASYNSSFEFACNFSHGEFIAITKYNNADGDYVTSRGYAGELIGEVNASSINNYYSKDSYVQRTTTEEYLYKWEEQDGCDTVQKQETRYKHGISNSAYYACGSSTDTSNFKSSSYITGTLGWGEFKGLNELNTSDVWVIDGDFPKLYTDYCHSVAVVRKFKDTVIGVDYYYVDNNHQFNYVSEEMPGYVPYPESIAETITSDKVYTITYDYIKYNVLINCRDEAGNLIGTFVERIYENTAFSFPAPEVTGYTPVNPVIEGVMATSDISLDIDYYANEYTVNISYQNIDGTPIAPSYVGKRDFGESLNIQSPIIVGNKLAVDSDSTIVIPKDYVGNFEYIVTYIKVDQKAYTVTAMFASKALSGVQVTFNGETKETDVSGRAIFNYEAGTEYVSIKIHKDGYSSGRYENETEYKLKDTVGIDYFDMKIDTVDNPHYFIQGISCYGNDIEKDFGVINVKYGGYVPIVVKGNIQKNDKITKIQLVQEVESAKIESDDPTIPDFKEGTMVRRIISTVEAGSSDLSNDGVCVFDLLGSQFMHSKDMKYPIYVYMYTEMGNEPVVQRLKIDTVSFMADFKFEGLLDDTSITLKNTGLSFLDNTKISLKPNKDEDKNINYRSELPFEIVVKNNEVYVGYNMGDDFYSAMTKIDTSTIKSFKDNTQARANKWLKDMTEKVDDKLTSKNKKFKTQSKASFEIKADAYGGLCFTIGENQKVMCQTYFRAKLGVEASWTSDFLLVFIPITVTVSVSAEGEVTIDGFGFDFEHKKLIYPDNYGISLTTTIGLSVGLGNRIASIGVFGRLSLGTEIVIGETTYFDALVLSGTGGFYAKLNLGILTLYGEKAWNFNNVILTTRDSIKTANIPPENSDGFVGVYNDLPVYDISAYSFLEQQEILNIPQWTVKDAWEIESPEADSESDPIVTIDASEERIVEIENQRIAVYFANDTESAAANAKVLVYSVYDETKKTWTSPRIVSDNGTGDTVFDIINYNGKVYLVYGESNTVFEYSMYIDDTTLINDMAFSQDIRVAVYDSATMSFNNVIEITSDDYYDTMPVWGIVNDELYLAWVKNTAHDDATTFCMNTDNYIYYTKLVGENWTEPSIVVNNCFPVLDMTVAELSDQPCIAFIVDEDVNLYSEDDKNIYISDLSGSTYYVNCYGNTLSELLAVNKNNSSFLLWKSGNEIKVLRSLGGTPESFSGLDNSIGENYMFVSVDNNTDALLWAVKDIGADNSEGNITSEIYASYSYKNGEWTNPSVLMSVPYHLMSFDVLVQDDTFEFVFTNINVVTEEDSGVSQGVNSYSRIFYKTLDVPYIANISDIVVEVDKNNNKVNISFTVTNDGAFVFDKINATLIDAVKQEVTFPGGRPGGSGSIIIKSAPISSYSNGIGGVITTDTKQYTVSHNEYDLGELACELMPGASGTINVAIDLIDAMVLEDYSIEARVLATQFSSPEPGQMGAQGGSSVIVSVIGSRPSSPEGTIVEQLYPDIAVSGEYIIIGETEYVSMRVENIGKSVATINNLELYRTNYDGTVEEKPFYEQSFESLMPNQVVYYLLKLDKDFFEETSETFKCMIACLDDQDLTNNATIVVARKLEGAEGTQRDLLVEVPVLDSYQQTFDKYLPYSSDINIDITMTDDLLRFVGCVDENLSPVTPYLTEDGNDQHFVFNQNYLSSWETGWHDFSFIYLTQAGYIDILYTINVIDSTPIPLTGSIYITLDSDETPVIDTVKRGDKLTVDISKLNAELITFEWLINGEVVSKEKDYVIDDKYLGNNIQAKVKGVAPYYGEVLSQTLWIDKVHRQLTAPVITSTTEDNIVILQKSFHVGDDELYYGFSQINDGNTVSNWQTSNQLVIPNDGVYYLFTMAPGSSIYSKTISGGTLYSTLPGIIVNDVSNINYTLEGRVVTVQYSMACRIGYLQEDVFNIVTSSLSEDGLYSFVVPETVNEVILLVLGDIDCNGKVEEADIINLKNFVLNKGGVVGEYGLFAGDIDTDGTITALDISLMTAASTGNILLPW